MTAAALVIGLLIAAQGIFGLAAPEAFFETVLFMQTPPVIYGAALVRFACGVILFKAAKTSRAPVFLAVLGTLFMAGGLLTPFFGTLIGGAILTSWAEGGTDAVRAWAAGSLALGLLIILGVGQQRPKTRPFERRNKT